MSVPIIASAWNYFHKLNKQDFTGIIIQALSMSKLIKDFDENDRKQLIWLRTYTHKDIKRSIFELDRYVDETKGNVSNKSFSFPNGTFTQDEIQNYLCIAIQEVYEIIYKNFKDYKDEEKLYVDDDEQVDGSSW